MKKKMLIMILFIGVFIIIISNFKHPNKYDFKKAQEDALKYVKMTNYTIDLSITDTEYDKSNGIYTISIIKDKIDTVTVEIDMTSKTKVGKYNKIKIKPSS